MANDDDPQSFYLDTGLPVPHGSNVILFPISPKKRPEPAKAPIDQLIDEVARLEPEALEKRFAGDHDDI